jgi:hypothetical protein
MESEGADETPMSMSSTQCRSATPEGHQVRPWTGLIGHWQAMTAQRSIPLLPEQDEIETLGVISAHSRWDGSVAIWPGVMGMSPAEFAERIDIGRSVELDTRPSQHFDPWAGTDESDQCLGVPKRLSVAAATAR